jgi:dihydroorotase
VLEPGAPADLVVFDPAARWTVEAGSLVSVGKITPFSGLVLEGRVRWTLVAGEIAFARDAAGQTAHTSK